MEKIDTGSHNVPVIELRPQFAEGRRVFRKQLFARRVQVRDNQVAIHDHDRGRHVIGNLLKTRHRHFQSVCLLGISQTVLWFSHQNVGRFIPQMPKRHSFLLSSPPACPS